MQGIGDSGQGWVNMILFVLLTKQVRDSFLRLFCCKSVMRVNEQHATEKTEPNDTAACAKMYTHDARLANYGTPCQTHQFINAVTSTPVNSN